jgi:hypothetical protein
MTAEEINAAVEAMLAEMHDQDEFVRNVDDLFT